MATKIISQRDISEVDTLSLEAKSLPLVIRALSVRAQQLAMAACYALSDDSACLEGLELTVFGEVQHG